MVVRGHIGYGAKMSTSAVGALCGCCGKAGFTLLAELEPRLQIGPPLFGFDTKPNWQETGVSFETEPE